MLTLNLRNNDLQPHNRHFNCNFRIVDVVIYSSCKVRIEVIDNEINLLKPHFHLYVRFYFVRCLFSFVHFVITFNFLSKEILVNLQDKRAAKMFHRGMANNQILLWCLQLNFIISIHNFFQRFIILIFIILKFNLPIYFKVSYWCFLIFCKYFIVFRLFLMFVVITVLHFVFLSVFLSIF